MRIIKLQSGIVILITAALVICLGFGSASATDANAMIKPGQYRIGPGDVLEIAVWKNPDLTRVVTVLPDGNISFPLIDQITAADKTLEQLSTELRSRLDPFVPDVDLSIIIAQVNSQVVYVIGKVRNPGRIAMNTPLNVMQALATAGGLSTYANGKDIRIFRTINASETFFPFDYNQAAKGTNPDQNILLRRGDVIVVP